MRATWVRSLEEDIPLDLLISLCWVDSTFHPSEFLEWVKGNTGINIGSSTTRVVTTQSNYDLGSVGRTEIDKSQRNLTIQGKLVNCVGLD